MDLQFILNTDNFINKFCVSDMEIEMGPLATYKISEYFFVRLF